MAKRTPAPKSGAPEEITDEWGIYDPGKAGMPALFKRLGRPVLQASPKASRNERRRAHRPERTSHGVGMALEEARRRAGLMPVDGFEPISQSPARAMRAAMRHAPAEPAHFVPDAAASTPGPAHPALHHAPPAAHGATSHAPGLADAAPVRKKRPARRTAKTAHADLLHAPVPEPAAPLPTAAERLAAIAAPVAPEPADAPAVAPERPRARRAPRVRHAQAAAAQALADAVPTAAAAAPTVKAGPPAPSPRRPRGPVPLAAWARASHDAPAPAPRRHDPLGFWRGWFRMPAEVALVEYARGARIHRLMIESIEDQPADLF